MPEVVPTALRLVRFHENLGAMSIADAQVMAELMFVLSRDANLTFDNPPTLDACVAVGTASKEYLRNFEAILQTVAERGFPGMYFQPRSNIRNRIKFMFHRGGVVTLPPAIDGYIKTIFGEQRACASTVHVHAETSRASVLNEAAVAEMSSWYAVREFAFRPAPSHSQKPAAEVPTIRDDIARCVRQLAARPELFHTRNAVSLWTTSIHAYLKLKVCAARRAHELTSRRMSTRRMRCGATITRAYRSTPTMSSVVNFVLVRK
jgi:hypothetical protein